MLVELGLVEQRYQAVREVLEGAPVIEVARRYGVAPLPGRSSVHRTLVWHGLVAAEKRKRRRSEYRRWERGRSMELWQVDVGGPIYLADVSCRR